ncbi:MAG TPA: hypothetical protein VNS58_23875 [Puia sp.]|nr:hypothetical protein [Puia sp.]
MSEKKIIRTALDPTPSTNINSTIPDDYDWQNDPAVLRHKALVEDFIKKHGLPKSFYEATKK